MTSPEPATPAPSNREQIEFWNGTAAERWLREQELLDGALSPFGLAAMDRLAPLAGEQIVDVGCGSGQTLLQLAERVGSSGRVLGVDPSRPLLERARERTRQRGVAGKRFEVSVRVDQTHGEKFRGRNLNTYKTSHAHRPMGDSRRERRRVHAR